MYKVGIGFFFLHEKKNSHHQKLTSVAPEIYNSGTTKQFCWLENANHVKFTDECLMCIEKHVFVKKNIYKWAKHEFTIRRLSQKDSSKNGNTLILQSCWLSSRIWNDPSLFVTYWPSTEPSIKKQVHPVEDIGISPWPVDPSWAAQQNKEEVLLWSEELGVNMLQSVPSPTHLSHITNINPFENKVWEVYFSKEVCSFVIIVYYVSACMCIRVVVSWLYNILISLKNVQL